MTQPILSPELPAGAEPARARITAAWLRDETEAVNDLLATNKPLVVVAKGRRDLLAAADNLLKGLHWDRAEIVDEGTVEPHRLANRDLLLLGWPQHAELRPRLPDGLTIDAPAALAWHETRGDALFAVFRHPGPAKSFSAVLVAADPEAARVEEGRVIGGVSLAARRGAVARVGAGDGGE